MIEVSGSALNDGFYTVQSYTETSMWGFTTIDIVVAETLIDEPKGETIEIINQSLPGDRTVFIESTDPDHLPSDNLLDLARVAIEYGEAGTNYQPSCGDIASTLYVERVSVANFYIEILNLDCDAATIDQCKAKIVEDLEAYFDLCRPFITGLDFEMDRRDFITDLSVGKIVQGVLDVYGALADGIRISVGSAGAETVTSYQLNQGEIAILALVFSDDDPDWSV